jgi:hypothetical protein
VRHGNSGKLAQNDAPMSARGRKWTFVGTQPEGRHRPTEDIPIGREGAPEGYAGFGGGDLLDPVCNMVISLAPAEKQIIAAWRANA